MKTRIINAKILTMVDNEKIFDGEIEIENGTITYLGPKKTTKEIFDKIIDAQRNLIMPGFKNAHTHSSMTFLRSYADDLPLQKWLYEAVFPMEAKLTPLDVYYFAKLAIAEYLSSGITANFDMYMEPAMLAKASIDCGFRTVILGCVNNFTESIAIMKENYLQLNKLSPLITYRLGFHAEYTTDKSILIDLANLAHEFKEPVYTHSSETQLEVDGCRERHGLTPTALFEQLGLFDFGGGCYHCVALNDDDIDIFKKRKVFAISCPGSNTKLASGIAEIEKLYKKGITIALGTDGPASNNCLDMFREMFLVTGLQKILQKDASALDAELVMKMATVNGAKAMKLDNADVLAIGKAADLIMIDLKQPNMQPINNIIKNLVYSGSKANIAMTMINGRVLFENGKYYLDENIEEIYRQCQERTNRLKANL